MVKMVEEKEKKGLEKLVEEMEKKAIEKEIDTTTETTERVRIEEEMIERVGSVPSGWSDSYYGIHREGDAYRTSKRIIIEEDEEGRIIERTE